MTAKEIAGVIIRSVAALAIAQSAVRIAEVGVIIAIDVKGPYLRFDNAGHIVSYHKAALVIDIVSNLSVISSLLVPGILLLLLTDKITGAFASGNAKDRTII